MSAAAAIQSTPIFSSVSSPKDPSLAPLISRVKTAVQSRWFVWGKESLKRELSTLTPIQLQSVIESATLDAADPQELLRTIDCLIELLSLDTLGKAVREAYPQYQNSLQTAQELCAEAKQYLEQTRKIEPSVVWRLLSAIGHALIIGLEGFLAAFGIADFFKPVEDEWHAQSRGYKIMMLSHLFTILTACLKPLFGEESVVPIVAKILVAISALSLVYPYLRPMPTKILKTVNWSEAQRQLWASTPVVRRSTLGQMARTFAANSHVMLLGETGVGKTETGKDFTAHLGDFPALKGKQVFYLNAAKLIGHSESCSLGNKTLERIKEETKGHRDDVILIIDEIHLVCQQRENSAVSDELKTLLDPSQEGFKHVIGITTEQEYYRDIYVQHEAFARRFEQISVKNTLEPETLRILSGTLSQKAPDALIEPDVLIALCDQVASAFDKPAAPATHLKILAKCIERVSAFQKLPLENDIETLSDEIQSIIAANTLGHGAALLPYKRSHDAAGKLNALSKSLKEKEDALEKQRDQIAQFDLKRKQASAMKKAVYESVLKVAQDTLPSPTDAGAKRFLLLSHFAAPSLVQYLKQRGKELGVKVEIDESLVKTVIEEEKLTRQKAKEAASRGRTDIQARGSSVDEKSPSK